MCDAPAASAQGSVAARMIETALEPIPLSKMGHPRRERNASQVVVALSRVKIFGTVGLRVRIARFRVRQRARRVARVWSVPRTSYVAWARRCGSVDEWVAETDHGVPVGVWISLGERAVFPENAGYDFAYAEKVEPYGLWQEFVAFERFVGDVVEHVLHAPPGAVWRIEVQWVCVAGVHRGVAVARAPPRTPRWSASSATTSAGTRVRQTLGVGCGWIRSNGVISSSRVM